MTTDGRKKRNPEAERLRRRLRKALAEYIHSEGCSCCENTKEHDKAATKLANLLNVPKYKDGSGHDFDRYRRKDK